MRCKQRKSAAARLRQCTSRMQRVTREQDDCLWGRPLTSINATWARLATLLTYRRISISIGLLWTRAWWENGGGFSLAVGE
jgi:hypothetical protein